MSNKYDTIADLKPGRYDYKIKCRIIRKWRGSTRTGEEFRAFNILLLDKMVNTLKNHCPILITSLFTNSPKMQKSRIHAFIPGFCVDNLEHRINVGKVCSIMNFTVQNYKEADIFRCLFNEKQLIFSKDTKIEDLEDKRTGIETEMFDFYDHTELRKLAGQRKYLAGKYA